MEAREQTFRQSIGLTQSCMRLLFSYKCVGTEIFRFLRTAVRKGYETVSKTVVVFKLLLKILVFFQNE